MPPMQVTHDWFRGYIAGIEAFAWWADGVQMVGSCGKTLAQATVEAYEKYEVINPKDVKR